MPSPRNPIPTVDIIIELGSGGIVLIRRKNPPPGWAIPGGFVDYGESVETAAVREALEETTLHVQLAFDHGQILRDYFRYKRTGERPRYS